MAALDGVHADEGYINTGGTKDGPVLTMMSKRLRALRKKFNRILQIEENKAQGKVVNKEQEEVLKTKTAIAALIEEYEKLRQPLCIAIKEELAERERELLVSSLDGQDEAVSTADDNDADEQERGLDTRLKLGAELEGGDRSAAEQPPEILDGLVDGVSSVVGIDLQLVEVADSKSLVSVEEPEESLITFRRPLTDSQIGDLLTLLYFSQLFDVRSPIETPSFVWTKVHERSSCLSYDFVRDDVTTPLIEGDLDALSMFGSLLMTRPANVTLSHKEALERCLEHAKSWLATSENLIGGSSSEMAFSYSGLRERLNRILSSEYFTMTPELTTVSQQTAAAAASAAGQYVTKVFVSEAPAVLVIGAEVVDDPVYHQVAPSQYYQAREYTPAGSLVVANGVPVPPPLVGLTNVVAFVPETHGGSVDVPQHGSHDSPNNESQDWPDTDAVVEQEHSNTQSVPVQQGQPESQGYFCGGVHRVGGYQNARGRVGHAGGRGRGGFANGRGGRGGRSGHPNGARTDRQFYDQVSQVGYYPRNQNHYGGGRVGRFPRGVYNDHSNGPAHPTTTTPSPPTGSA